MEKLQQALQQAREQRESSLGAVSRTQARQAAPGVDELWSALRPIELNSKHLTRNRILSYDVTRDSTPLDILRTKVLLQMRKNGWKRLAITSPTAGCGKSTIAANMATGFSRQTDMRAILLEMDLRRPSLARILGESPERDISRVLSGEVTFAEQAMRIRENVALGIARRASSDPAQYMLSDATETLLSEIEAAYQPDMMIFDLPPLMVSDDTRAFLTRVDCALIVAEAERSTVGHIDNCEREVAEHTNVLGVVLNQARHLDENSGYGYGYGYGYGE